MISQQARRERLAKANKAIEIIASYGRRFFYDRKTDHVARIEMDERGRLWWIDEYSFARIYMHNPGRWRGFTHGGTMSDLAIHLRNYVMHGKLLPRHALYWPQHYCDGDLWGYGADMQIVRNKLHALGVCERQDMARTGPYIAQSKKRATRNVT